MPSITFDGQSFQVEGRRVWLVSGSVSYAHLPRSQWGQVLRAAQRAGLNTIETPVIWAVHEPRQGQFDFEGDHDLRAFVEMIQELGMYCILRPGPFVGRGLDLGGLPPWLLAVDNLKVRMNNQPFLEACSRYITAVAAQVRDLQITAPGAAGGVGSGGIILVQNESEWTCGHDGIANAYLGELARYQREAGISVPLINSNGLWAGVESEIDTWTGSSGMLSNLRQLGAVRPNQPKLVADFRVEQLPVWGQERPEVLAPEELVRQLAEVVAAGGQFNIVPFHAGTNFGYIGGRDPYAPGGFLCASRDAGAPISESGMPGPSYSAVRRICTFASQFDRLLANLDPRRHPVTIHPDHPEFDGSTGEPTGVSLTHISGSQGGVAFLFAPRREHAAEENGAGSPTPKSKSRKKTSAKGSGADAAAGEGGGGRLTLLMPDGSSLPVDMGGLPVFWCVLDTRLTGRAHLDYTNLCAFALVGRVLVCFGPAGATGIISINGARLETEVPTQGGPSVHEHEGVTVVVASVEQLDSIVLTDDNVYVGVASVDIGAAGGEDRVTPLPDHKNYLRLSGDGAITTVRSSGSGGKAPASAPAGGGSGGGGGGKPGRIALAHWSIAETTSYVDGTSARYASIAGPADLNALGAPYGYGWYRLKLHPTKAGKQQVVFPESGHRLHLWLDAAETGVVGLGPGASDHAALSVKKKDQTLVILAENLGRFAGGIELGERTGLYGHGWTSSVQKVGKPKLVDSEPVNLLGFKTPLWRVHEGATTDPRRMAWTVTHHVRTKLLMTIGGELGRAGGGGLVLVNGAPVHYFEQGGMLPLVLDEPVLTKGKNTVEIALASDTAAHADVLERAVSFAETGECVTEKAEWAFAKWEPPAAELFAPAKTMKAGGAGGSPAWWKAEFEASADVEGAGGGLPLFFDATGLTKGQLYLNGRHVSRYFVATGDGTKVPPQSLYFLPRSYLKADGEGLNELMVFDEHGAAPTKTSIVMDAAARAIE